MRHALLITSLVLISACGGGAVSDLPGETLPPEFPTQTLPSYITEGTEIPQSEALLFFMKANDPFSKKNHSVLQKLYGSGGAKISTYRVEFEHATGARLKFGVLVEDTFVLLDAKGQRVQSYLHPTEQELKSLLQRSLPAAK